MNAVGHHLLAMPSSFLGREHDVAAVADLLTGSRLVTVTGPSGMGKSRLALEVAVRVADRYPDGVWLVELAAARHDDEVPAAVAAALSVTAEDGPLLPALRSALRHRRVLLVLDNCEHLVQASAELVHQLLRGCPELSVLATSQEALATPGEQRWQLGPLPLPAEQDSIEALAECPAVRLFVERAAARRPGFTLTPDTAPAVAEICRRLDGLPLAIELAAARVEVLEPVEIARRLDDRFRLLSGGGRTVARRHQTLRAALDWSHDLLPDSERLLFHRLAVFAGGWTLDAATQVCAGDGIDADEVLDLLAALVRRSLVVPEGAPTRYRLLDTTRHYARDRLVESETAAVFAARHAHWCVALVERAEPQLASGDQRAWLADLDAERDNVQTALSFAADGGHDELLLRLSAALVLFWSMRGRSEEGLGWLERALAGPAGPPERRGTALWGASRLATGDHETADARAHECLTIADELGDVRLRARALGLLGAVGVSACDGSAPRMELLQESVALAEQADDAWCQVASLVALGFAHLVQGARDEARGCFQRCLAVADRHPTSEGHRLHALIGLARTELAGGDHRAAEPRLHEAVTLARGLGVLTAAANALRFLGEAASTRGDYDTARGRFQESLDVARRSGAAGSAALALSALGRLALTRGDTDAAGEILEQSRALALAQDPRSGAGCALTGLGAVERAVGDADQARTQLDEALATARRVDDHEAAAKALRELALLARSRGEHARAVALHHEALTLYREVGDEPAIAACLEQLAGLEALQDHWQPAARLLGAAQAVRDGGGYARPPTDQAAYDADVARIRSALGADALEQGWAEGAAASVEEAVSYAARGRGPRPRADHGWDSLSDRERDAALLAADGLTNPEIAQRLFISPRTVQSHLASAYTKLGIASRKQLAAAAAER